MLREMRACNIGPKPFKYETMWEREDSLFATVNGRWNMQAADFVAALHAKLDDLVGDLSTWDRTQFGSVKTEIRQLKTALEHLRSVPGRSGPTHEEAKVADRLVELFHREEMLWRQRAHLD